MTEIIRNYHDNDRTELHRIHDLARPIELAGSCDPRAFVALAEDKEDLAEFDKAQKFVTAIDDRIVGFIGIDDNIVGWLYVDPENIGRGIGRRLLQFALTQLTDPGIVYVLNKNEVALKLYKSEGFTVTDQFKSKNNGYPCTVLKLEQRVEQRSTP